MLTTMALMKFAEMVHIKLHLKLTKQHSWGFFKLLCDDKFTIIPKRCVLNTSAFLYSGVTNIVRWHIPAFLFQTGGSG